MNEHSAINLHVDRENGVYIFQKDGERERLLPTVTTVIGDVLADFPDDELAMLRGRIVHHACALLDGGGDGSGLDWPSLRPEYVGYVQAWEKFMKDTGFEILEVEQAVVCEKMGYAGTLDRVGILKEMTTILDIKTSRSIWKTEGVQTAAYAHAWKEMRGFRGKIQRITVHLTPEGKYNLAPPWKDVSDIYVFQAALQCYRWRRR